MKVLHVTPSYFPAFVYGGPIRSTHHMNLGLAARGITVRVLTTDANGGDRLAESGKGVSYSERLEVEYVPRTFKPDVSLGLLWKLPAAVRWADVVHITAVYSFSTIPALAWGAWYGKPVFWSPRGALQEWEGSPRRGLKSLWDAICRMVAGKKTTIIAASEREAQAAQQRFPRMPVRVVGNGVVIPEKVSHIESGVLRILFLGRLHPIKGIENLLEACALLRAGGQKVSVRLAGPAEKGYRGSLEELVRRLELRKEVEFVGAVEEAGKDELFANADVLVLPSFSENFGLVVAEALAHGVPVIASQHTPWSGVEEKKCGRWVPNDGKNLAAALTDISKADRGAWGERGRAWMQAEFSWEHKTKQLSQYYEEQNEALTP